MAAVKESVAVAAVIVAEVAAAAAVAGDPAQGTVNRGYSNTREGRS